LTRRVYPNFKYEREFWRQGIVFVAGLDEAGRGALAGPVSAAAVMLPVEFGGSWLKKIKDSKLLTPEEREWLMPRILKSAISFGVGFASHGFIDGNGIVAATRHAMMAALAQMKLFPQALIIDFLHLPYIPLPQRGIVDGDFLSISIACASVLAKVSRDRLMIEMDAKYPGYGFIRHKGYCTEEHLESLSRLGPTEVHRRSFQPIMDLNRLL